VATDPSPLTVALPVYNGERYLQQALESWVNQTYQPFTLLLLDNASTDDTGAICRAYARRDARVRYVRNDTNIGASANFNKAFRLNRSPYFKWASHDDLYAPDFLRRCMAVLETDPSVVLAYSHVALIDEDGEELGDPWVAPSGQFSDDPAERFASVLHETTWCFEVFGVIRASALRRSSLMGIYYGSDRVLLTELSLKGAFHQVPAPLFLRRCHDDQSTSAHMTPRKREHWVSGRRPNGLVFPQRKMVTGYVKALRDAHHLTLSERLQGAASLLRLVTRPDKLKRFVVPGPHNYFGIRGRQHQVPPPDPSVLSSTPS